MKSHPVSPAIYVLFALLFTQMSAMAAAPENPHHPFPADGASVVQRVVDLSWLASDADDDSLTYSVYFGISEDPPLVKSSWAGEYFDPYEVLGGPLAENTTYYWRIVVNDGLSWISGDYWSFTTTSKAIIDSLVQHDATDQFNSATSAMAADMDDDGDLDLIGSSYYQGLISWWENDGTSVVSNWTEHPVDDASNSYNDVFAVDAADIDSDGDVDLVGSYYSSDKIIWWENTDAGTTWADHTVTDAFNNVRGVNVEDIDGDGDLDVLGAAFYGGVVWWENDGTTIVSNWTERTVTNSTDGYYWADAADLDGDGDLDILSGAGVSGEINWWENDGTNNVSNWTSHPIGSGYDNQYGGAFDVQAVDMDTDGDLDVIGATATVNDIFWWENLGGGSSWSEHTVDSNYPGARSVDAADMDGDGDMDLLGAAFMNGGDFSWWENDGTNVVSNWTKHTVGGFVSDANHSAYSISTADINGDGAMDVLGADNYADNIIWWEALTAESPGPFALLSPMHDDTLWSSETTFTWGSSVDPNPGDSVYYDVSLDTLPDLSTAQLVADGIADTSVSVTELLDDHEYFWTVVAFDTSGNSAWASDTFHFSTYFPEPPDSFTLIAPTDSSGIPSVDQFPLTFYWEQSADPDPGDSLVYFLELSTDTLFNLPMEYYAGSADSLQLDSLEQNAYSWRVVAVDNMGLETVSTETWLLDVTLASPEVNASLPEDYSIASLYPNPFNPSLSVVVALPEAADLTVTVHNLLGREVERIAQGKHPAGFNAFTFDGSNLASGIYFVHASVPNKFRSVKKVVLMK